MKKWSEISGWNLKRMTRGEERREYFGWKKPVVII